MEVLYVIGMSAFAVSVLCGFLAYLSALRSRR